MTMEHPNVLYVGSPARGQQLADAVRPDGWHVYLPGDMLAALGAYVIYMPDITVIEADHEPDFTIAVYHHLRSVGAQTLLVLTDDPLWDAADSVRTLSPCSSPLDVQLVISDMLHQHEFERAVLT